MDADLQKTPRREKELWVAGKKIVINIFKNRNPGFGYNNRFLI
jgi:hypothetical protein